MFEGNHQATSSIRFLPIARTESVSLMSGGRTSFAFSGALRAMLVAAAVAFSYGPVRAQMPTSGASFANASDATDADFMLQHLRDSLSDEMFATYRLFIYVDEAQTGRFAQHMYVFEKADMDDLALDYDWPVSTGRSAVERDAHGRVRSTVTPRGYFGLDPRRMFAEHVSSQWNEAMPYAMFFDWAPNGHATGLAIHGAPQDDQDALGIAASAGCIRLSLDNAHTLFDLVRTRFRGPAPKIAYLDGREGVSSEGLLLHDSQGNLQMADGYSVLVLIDDFDAENQISALTGAAAAGG